MDKVDTIICGGWIGRTSSINHIHFVSTKLAGHELMSNYDWIGGTHFQHLQAVEHGNKFG